MTDKQQKWLKALKTITNINTLVMTLNLTPQTQAKFWEELLALLQSEENPLKWNASDKGGSENIEDEDIRTMFGFITQNADLKHAANIEPDAEILFSALYEEIKSLVDEVPEEFGFWNESVQRLINFIITRLNHDDNTVILPIEDDHSITIGTLKDADAGNNFPQPSEEDKWVIPWWNIDNESYDDVRKKDEVLEILKNDKKMQYTHSKLADWIRLLMPQYGRRVEVEDIDRNFWVIAQVIAAISNYLLGEDAPIPKTLEGLTREITEIWENIPYLWLQIAMMSQEGHKEIKVIHTSVLPRANEHGRKYDNIGEENDNYCTWSRDNDGYIIINNLETEQGTKQLYDEVISRIDYLREQYSGYNLCVIPYIRLNNYKHNYYSMEYYPGIFFYEYVNRDNESHGWRVLPLQNRVRAAEQKQGPIIVSLQCEKEYDLKPYVYALKQEEDCFRYCFPFADAAEISTVTPYVCYGTLRTIANIRCSLNEEGMITIENKLTLSIYDAVSELVEGEPRFLATFKQQNVNKGSMSFALEDFVTPSAISNIITNNYQINRMGCYMGEVASSQTKTANITQTDNLFTSNAYVLKIGNYLPTDGNFTMAAVNANGTYKFTSMRGNVTKYRNYYSPNVNTKYYRFRWDSYNNQYDGTEDDPIGSIGNNYCYNKPPVEKPCTYPNKQTLDYDGLTAVKNYIKASYGTQDDISKNPAFFITTVGLTPWQGGGRSAEGSSGLGEIYWDSSLVHAIYFFIPSIKNLTGYGYSDSKHDLSNYIEAYDRINMLPLQPATGQCSSDEVVDGSPEVVVNNEVIGKIVMCAPIDRYEGYFYNYNDSPNCYYVINYGRWRQFYVINDDTINSCQRIDINGGADAPGGKSKYKANFIAKFTGNIRYYDVNRFNVDGQTGEIYESASSQVSDARVQIDNNGYQQTIAGKIVQTNSSASFDTFNNRTNIAYLNTCTGFQQPARYDSQTGIWQEVPDNILNLIVNSINENATIFHGSTPLDRNSGNLCIYKV